MLAHRILLSSTLLLGLGQQAFAQAVDGEAFAERVQATFAAAGFPLDYSGVRDESGTIVLEGVTFGEGAETTEVGEARFEGVTGSDTEGWRSERGTFDDFQVREATGVTNVEGLAVEGLSIREGGEGAGQAFAIQTPTGETLNAWFDRLLIAAMRVEQDGRETFALQDLDVANDVSSPTDFSFDMSVGSFSLATSGQGEEASVPEQIGYERFTGNIEANGAWNMETGDLSLSPLQINIDDAGEMNFAYHVAGYTPQFITQLRALQQQMAANPDNQGASGMAMIGLLSQLTIHSAELRFVDDSLTNRLLDHYAEENGQTREALIDQLVGSLPGFLSALNNPQFQTEVTEAVQSFLRDPQSITVSIAPDQPVPAAQIMGAAMGAPQTLPAVLSLTVRSND